MSTVSTAMSNDGQATPVKRGRILWLKRVLLAVIVLIFALPTTGIIYESVMAASDAERYPAPGQMVAVDGHQMHLNCVGTGSPTVLLESGFNSTSLDWGLVQPEIAQFNRVCAYDRAGLGWSALGLEPRTPEQIVTELHTLLQNAAIEAPYVLVGHSIGGKYIRMYADLYPNEVSGMVMVDARHESMEPPARTPEENQRAQEDYRASLGMYVTLGKLGVARAFGSWLLPALNTAYKALPAETRTLIAMFSGRQSTIDTMVAESSGETVNDDQLRIARLPVNMPLVVLAADSSLKAEPKWLQAQQLLADLTHNSRLQEVANADHIIQLTQPTVVIEAVRDVVEAVRTGKSLAP